MYMYFNGAVQIKGCLGLFMFLHYEWITVKMPEGSVFNFTQ